MEDLKHGFAVHESFEKHGFRDGDKILDINGEVPLDIMDVNVMVLLRDGRSIQIGRAHV